MVDPVLKWAGGKRSLATSIIKLFPLDYRDRRYHEPFFGGGALFFKIRPRSGSINDVNPDLMNFYRVVRDEPEDLISQAKNYTYDEEIYYNLRDRFNRRDIPAVERAALMLYLNKTAYNGLYRVNSRGEFNVPFGTYSNPTIVPEEKIRFASRLLSSVEILNEDFSYVSRCANEGDLCYLDPPYQPVGGTANFTSYSSGGFSLGDQRRLRDLCVKLDEMGVLFVLSNSLTEHVLELYNRTRAFRTVIIQARRQISSKVLTRGFVGEVLITNIS